MKIIIILLLISINVKAFQSGNTNIDSFEMAKKLMKKESLFYSETLYCGCKIEDKKYVDKDSCGYVPPKNSSRAGKIEYEHVAAAESFGQSFDRWRNYKNYPDCRGKTGRKCAEKDPEFKRMESDMHNLWAEDGLVNLLRSNKKHDMLQESEYTFGKCDIKLTKSAFMAREKARGAIARTLKYMDKAYPGRGVISESNRKLYDAWDKMYPATKLECDHHKGVMKYQLNENEFTVSACKKAGLSYK